MSLRQTQLSLFGSSSSLDPLGSRACLVRTDRRARPVRIVRPTRPNPPGSLGLLARSGIKPASFVQVIWHSLSESSGRLDPQGCQARSIHQGRQACLVRISNWVRPVRVVKPTHPSPSESSGLPGLFGSSNPFGLFGSSGPPSSFGSSGLLGPFGSSSPLGPFESSCSLDVFSSLGDRIDRCFGPPQLVHVFRPAQPILVNGSA